MVGNHYVMFYQLCILTDCTDAQQWYIEYLHGQLDGSFLIISKLNGKALYCKGGAEALEVKAAERRKPTLEKRWLLHCVQDIE